MRFIVAVVPLVTTCMGVLGGRMIEWSNAAYRVDEPAMWTGVGAVALVMASVAISCVYGIIVGEDAEL